MQMIDTLKISEYFKLCSFIIENVMNGSQAANIKLNSPELSTKKVLSPIIMTLDADVFDYSSKLGFLLGSLF